MNNQVKKNKNYLSSQVKAIIVIAILIAVFIPLWFFVLKPEEIPTTPSEPTADYSLYDDAVYVGTTEKIEKVDSKDVESVFVQRTEDRWGFVYDYTEETYFLDGYGDKIAYDQYVAQYVVYYATSAPAISRVAEKADDLSRYGLDENGSNRISVTINLRSGKQIEMIFGDELADGTGFYATTAGSDTVYAINSFAHGYFDCSVYDVMNVRITNPFTESEYVPNYFVIYHGSEKHVELKYYNSSEAVDMEYIKTTQVIYPIAYIPYGASSSYSDMIYNYLRASINGERVVDAEKKGETFSAEYLKEKYGIDGEDPACIRLNYYRDFDDVGKIENDIIFSPKDKDGYYFAYNLALGTVVKIHADSIPFIEWEAERYMEPQVYLQSINTVKSLTINSTGLRDYYVTDGHIKLNQGFVSNAPEEVDAKNLKVTHADGSELKDAMKNGERVRTGLENYRYLFLALQSIDIHQKMSAEDVAAKNIDLNAPDVVVDIVTRSGAEHTLRFYYYGSSGAYFTYNGEGGYSVTQSSLKKLLTACDNLCKGVAIA